MRSIVLSHRLMSPFIAVFTLLSIVILSIGSCSESSENVNEIVDETDSTAYYAFRNSVNEPPEDYQGPRFELSCNYPTELPAGGADMPWMKIDVDFTDKNPSWSDGPWLDYINAIKKYAFEGQDQNLTNDAGWKADIDGGTRWFHVPWMAYNASAGREYVHGCTSERIASVEDFDGDGVVDIATGIGNLQHSNDASSITHFETWAVGMYNEYAGYAFSQLFPKTGVPSLTDNLPTGLPFPVGTCVVKTLFTTATDQEVPFLVNSPEWTVNRHKMQGDTTYLCERERQAVYLVQVDVAVVDPRSPTNWVFGTFAYNGTLDGATAVERLDPVGIQFAMDPGTFPGIEKDKSEPAYQSVLNDQMTIYEHFGCNGRLCGPVDNPEASCMSCHGGAYTAPMNELDKMGENIPQIFGFDGMCTTFNEQNEAFFSNRKYPEPYFEDMFPDAIPLDFSLQVQVAFTQYKKYTLNAKNTCSPTTPH